MKLRRWFLLILIAILIAAGGVYLSGEILLLELVNTDRSQSVLMRIDPGDRFSITYLHSMYREPVTEEFQADRDGVVLKGVRTKSSAVQEYYRFEDRRDFHPLTVKLGTLFIRVGEGEGQALIVRERTIVFSEVGERGDRIRLKVKSISRGSYLFSRLFG